MLTHLPFIPIHRRIPFYHLFSVNLHILGLNKGILMNLCWIDSQGSLDDFFWSFLINKFLLVFGWGLLVGVRESQDQIRELGFILIHDKMSRFFLTLGLRFLFMFLSLLLLFLNNFIALLLFFSRVYFYPWLPTSTWLSWQFWFT